MVPLQLVSVNKNNNIIVLCTALLSGCLHAQVADPFAFDYSNKAAVDARSDEHILTLTTKAAITTCIKDLDGIKLYLLDPASTEESEKPIAHLDIATQQAVNLLKLGLMEVIETKQDAPFCFYPNYKIVGYKGSEPVFTMMLSIGCGVYKAQAGSHQISDGYGGGKILTDYLNSALPVRPEDLNVEKVAEENARHLMLKLNSSAQSLESN